MTTHLARQTPLFLWQRKKTVALRAQARIEMAASTAYGFFGAAAIVRILTGTAPSKQLWEATIDKMNGSRPAKMTAQTCKDYLDYFDNCTIFCALLAEIDEETAQLLLKELSHEVS